MNVLSLEVHGENSLIAFITDILLLNAEFKYQPELNKHLLLLWRAPRPLKHCQLIAITAYLSTKRQAFPLWQSTKKAIDIGQTPKDLASQPLLRKVALWQSN